jgi:cysteine-rich repeat protein
MDLGAGERVAGITSGGTSFTCLADDHSFDVNVANYSAWITANAGADINSTSCGAGSQVGDPDVVVIENQGIILGAGDSVTFDFLLSAGSDQLRIAYNAHDSIASDFNMLVRQGAPPTDTLFDCKQDGTGQYGFCQFNNPAGGVWHVRVEQLEGSGLFQVTTTNFGAEPSVCGNNVTEPGEECDGSDDGVCLGLCGPSCACPAPICGNEVQEIGEACDGAADSGCVTECEPDCSCACMSDRLSFERLAIDHRRMLIKAAIDAYGGELADRDPRLGFTTWFSDGSNETLLEIPAGDPGWIKSKPTRRRFRWKGDIAGVRTVNIKDDASSPGLVSIKMKGKAVDGSADFDDSRPISAEIGIEGVCAGSLCGDTIVNETTGEECDEGILTVDCDLDCTTPICGDGFFNSLVGELCDDGAETAGCDLDCTLPVCGDATINEAAGEQCDDANAISTDVCPASCLAASCGDGYLCTNPACTSGPTGGAEQCDQGALNSNTIPNRCRTNCRPPTCGDDVTDSGETCDEAGEAPTCDDDCTAVSCGDGNANQSAGETCDTGGESATCDPNCSSVSCGDGYTNVSANEQCDDMDANFNDACPTTCKHAFCGDGFLCTFPDCTSGPTGGAEQCDQGSLNSDTLPNRCRTDCTAPSCGDLVTDPSYGEACDQGGAETPTCDPNCTSVVCGDNYRNVSAGEQCDDGNASNNDMCLATSCAVATCGDGLRCNHASCTTGPTGGTEECDNGAGNSDTAPNACRTNCADAHCGDGVDDSGEQCDDGGESADCDTNCTNASCGDSTVNATAGEQCDDGNGSNSDMCLSGVCDTATCGDGFVCSHASCTTGATGGTEQCDDGGESADCDTNCTDATCGDGTLNTTAGEQCDDGNTDPGDGCDGLCQTE